MNKSTVVKSLAVVGIVLSLVSLTLKGHIGTLAIMLGFTCALSAFVVMVTMLKN